jgi:transglutaminase-like putative cysteine protease
LFYLRSLNYDQYYSQGWYATTRRVYFYEPEQEAIRTYSSHQRLYRQDIDFESDFTGLMYFMGELAVADVKYGVAWREGSSLSEFRDMFGARTTRGRYQAYSVVPVFGENELREASVDYPDWLLARYLTVPSSVPERVLSLAEELTRFETNPYDKAVTLEQYLRTFTYTLDLPERPEDVDIVDYFLFEIQQGYCDYYASAMVIMARHLGLPSRLVVGYLVSTYDEEEEHFVVTADQAHSWVEIYFPEYGWVTFEPTAGRAAIGRESTRAQTDVFEQKIEFVEEDVPMTTWEIIQLVIAISIAAGLVGWWLFLRIDLLLLRRKQPQVVFAALYRRAQQFGERLSIPYPTTYTPYEFSSAYQEYLAGPISQSAVGGRLEPLKDQLSWLFDEYVRAIYSTDPPGPIERTRAVREWAGMRRRLTMAVIWQKISDWLERRRQKP